MLKLVSILTILLTVGVEQMWGADEVVHTLDGTTATGGNSSPHNSYTAAAEIDVDDITWSIMANSNQTPWRIGGKAASSGATATFDRAIYSKDAISDNITKIVLTHGTNNLTSTGDITITVSTAENGGGTVTNSFTRAFKASDTIIINRPAGANWSDKYFKFSYNVSIKGTSNKYLQFVSAEFYAAAAVAHTVTLMDNSATLTEASVGAGVTLPSRAGCTGYTFVGWTKSWTSAQTSWTTTAPTIIPAGSYSPTADDNLYPVYTKTEGGSGFTLSLNSGGTDYYVAPRSGNNGYFSITTTAGEAETFYLDEDNHMYFYAGETLTYVVAANSTTMTFPTSNPSYAWNVVTENGVTTLQTTESGGRFLGINTSTSPYRFSAYGSSYAHEFTKHSSSITSYISVPNCCTELASINGSVFWTG